MWKNDTPGGIRRGCRSCHVIARRPAGPTWARHQPSGLPNARFACVRLQSVFPAQRPAGGSGPYLALPLGELSPKVTERACWGFWFLPTVVPAGALPRNRLASSATGGASAICPLSRLRRQLPQRGSQAAGASAFRGVRYENLSFQQAVGADAEKGGQGTQLDIRDEALACLDALHGVFRRQVKPHPSHRQGPGTAQGQADGGGGNCTPRRDKKSPAERCSAGDF